MDAARFCSMKMCACIVTKEVSSALHTTLYSHERNKGKTVRMSDAD